MLKFPRREQASVFLLICSIILSGAFLVGCEEEGPAEKAGEALDQAVEDVGDTVEDAADKLEKKTD